MATDGVRTLSPQLVAKASSNPLLDDAVLTNGSPENGSNGVVLVGVGKLVPLFCGGRSECCIRAIMAAYC